MVLSALLLAFWAVCSVKLGFHSATMRPMLQQKTWRKLASLSISMARNKSICIVICAGYQAGAWKLAERPNKFEVIFVPLHC